MDVSLNNLLPPEARDPVDDYTIDLVAAGLKIPSPAIAQRLAIDLQKAYEQLGRVPVYKQEEVQG